MLEFIHFYASIYCFGLSSGRFALIKAMILKLLGAFHCFWAEFWALRPD